MTLLDASLENPRGMLTQYNRQAWQETNGRTGFDNALLLNQASRADLKDKPEQLLLT